MKKLLDVVFGILWSLIIVISVHDGYLVLVHSDAIADLERNPIALLLLSLNRGNPWLLLPTKAAGTVIVACILLVLFWRWRPAGLIAAGAIAAFQVGLLSYLYYA